MRGEGGEGGGGRLPVGHSKAPLLLHGAPPDLLDHIGRAGDSLALHHGPADLRGKQGSLCTVPKIGGFETFECAGFWL